MLIFYFLCVLGAGPLVAVHADKAKCCGRVTGNCKRSCEQLAVLQENPKDKIAGRITEFYKHCSSKNVRHIEWCMSSLAEDTEIKWLDAARKCCDKANSDDCQLSCLNRNVGSRSVHRDCQDETEFFTCLQQQQVTDTCCGDKTDAAQCQIACEKFLANSPSVDQHGPDQELIHLCIEGSSESPSQNRCPWNDTVARQSNRQRYLHCCKLAEDEKCKEACQHSLRKNFDSDAEAVESLEGRGCGKPSLDNRFWQCFLQNDRTEQKDTSVPAPMSQIEKLGMDSVKLHCCDKATIPGCRKLCLKTFTNEWATSWNDFDSECLSHPKEEKLVRCLDDVEEPCDLGCDGMNYCTAFNNRPTDMFRSCSQQTDDAAYYDMTQWLESGTVNLFHHELPLKNVSKCVSEKWKTVSCILQIRPCARGSHITKICRNDCVDLLSTCLDWTSMAPSTSVNSLCARLSSETMPCVSLSTYSRPAAPVTVPDNARPTAVAPVTTPCKRNPCGPGSVCLVNRGCRIGRPCKPYRCVSGCKVGEVSHYLVPEHTYARIPTFNNQKGCVKVCQCINKSIDKCLQVPCPQVQSCWLAGKQMDHGAMFRMDCNTCICFIGEITCTKRHCESAITNSGSRHTGLPCNCVPHHVPVCGFNGQTYPNYCLAMCAGLADVDVKFGPCWKDNPCDGGHTCRADEKCVPTRQVCLSMLKVSCAQYKCVSVKDSCETMPKSPVCDTDNEDHINLCHLLRANKKFAYSGSCLVGCNSTGQVCGVDGNTYVSECAAFAESMSVDYAGPCSSSGSIGPDGVPYCDENVVKCPTLPQNNCNGIIPPGACCPKCAGVLRVLFSQKQVDRIIHTLQKRHTLNVLNLKSVFGALDRHVQTAECVVRGYLTMFQELLVFVESTVKNPTPLQLEVCIRESEKLSNMVETSSPRMMADLSLSTLILSKPVRNMVSDKNSSSASAAFQLSSGGIWLVLMLLII